MLYREYKQKLDKRLSIYTVLWRFRILILVALLLLIALISTSIGIKGIIYSEKCPETVTYGDHIQIKSRAFFCKTTLEYRTEGGSWSKEEPRAIGGYEVRAVSKRTGGSIVYGETFSYRVVPAKVAITVANNMYFGDSPTLYAHLKYGDRLITNDAVFDYEWLSEDTCNVSLDFSHLRVINEQGEDVTECYELSVSTTFVKVNRRPITLVIFGAEKIYDGSPLRSEACEITEGTLRDGDTIQIDYPVSITDVGEVDNTPSFRIRGMYGEIADRYYDVKKVIGKLIVRPRELTIKTYDVTMTYDGYMHYGLDDTFDVISDVGLSYGHTVTAVELPTVRNAGTYPNAITVEVYNGNRAVTENYKINYDFGTITVNKREIILATGSASSVYNGEPYKFESCDALPSDKKQSGLADNDRLSINEYTLVTTITDVGSKENYLVFDHKIYSIESREDVTDNYSVAGYRYGTLTVTPRPLRIRTVTREWTYDGQPHSAKEFDTYSDSQSGLVYGHSVITKDEITEFTEITEIGTIENLLKFDAIVVDTEMGRNVTRNYDIELEYGMLTIIKRPLSIKTASDQWEYDGESHFNLAVTVECAETQLALSANAMGQYTYGTAMPADATENFGSGLLVGHKFEITSELYDFTSIRYAGKQDNYLYFDFRIYDGTEDVTDKYSIYFTFGVLSVERRKISIKTAGEERYYDGIAHYNDEYTITSGQLVDGHSIFAMPTPFKDAGKYNNNIEIDILDAYGVVRTNNYSISFTYGTITVLPRELLIKTGSMTWIYDGLPHSCPEYTVLPSSKEGYGLAEGHQITRFVTLQITDATDLSTGARYVDNSVTDLQITDKDNFDVTSNYAIRYEYGQLRIKAPIVIYIYSLKKYYDGTPLGFSQNDYAIVSKPEEVIKVAVDMSNIRTLVDADSVTLDEIQRDIVVVAYDKNGKDVTEDNGIYFEGNDCPLQVLSRRIEVKSISISKVNDGNTLYGFTEGEEDKAAWISMGSLVNGHTIKIVVSGMLLPNQTTCLNTIKSVTIYDAEGNDVTYNYDIVLREGVLEWIPEKNKMG